jgi:hypothetical protein
MGCIADMYREINVCEARYALSQAIMRSRAERGISRNDRKHWAIQ